MTADCRATRAVLAVAIVVALAAPASAPAADRGKPSARELWQTYPLKATPTSSASATVQPPAKANRSTPARPRAAESSGGAPWVPIVLVVLVLALVAGVV